MLRYDRANSGARGLADMQKAVGRRIYDLIRHGDHSGLQVQILAEFMEPVGADRPSLGSPTDNRIPKNLFHKLL